MKKFLKAIRVLQEVSNKGREPKLGRGYFTAKENLNISDVSVQSKHSVGDRVKIKDNLDDIIGVSGMYLSKGPNHSLYKGNDNDGMNDFLGKDVKIVHVVFDDDFGFYRYLIDIDNGDYWWVDECFD